MGVVNGNRVDGVVGKIVLGVVGIAVEGAKNLFSFNLTKKVQVIYNLKILWLIYFRSPVISLIRPRIKNSY